MKWLPRRDTPTLLSFQSSWQLVLFQLAFNPDFRIAAHCSNFLVSKIKHELLPSLQPDIQTDIESAACSSKLQTVLDSLGSELLASDILQPFTSN